MLLNFLHNSTVSTLDCDPLNQVSLFIFYWPILNQALYLGACWFIYKMWQLPPPPQKKTNTCQIQKITILGTLCRYILVVSKLANQRKNDYALLLQKRVYYFKMFSLKKTFIEKLEFYCKFDRASFYNLLHHVAKKVISFDGWP